MKLILLLILLTNNSYPQFEVYLPDGSTKKYPKGTTYGEIKKDFAPMITDYICECGNGEESLSNVEFKFLTDEPLFIMTDDSLCIKKCIKRFDFSEYMHGWKVEMDIESYMKKNLLTDMYILETLGAPDRKPKNVTGDKTYELWYYNSYNLVLKIYNGYVYGYIRLE